jgi:FixJ family two-component response regulator
MWRIISGSS